MFTAFLGVSYQKGAQKRHKKLLNPKSKRVLRKYFWQRTKRWNERMNGGS
jgi:hypothetical protein